MGDCHWMPMEANPAVINKFLKEAGVPENVKMVDFPDLDVDRICETISEPTNIQAFLLLFPKSIQATDKGSEEPKDIYFVKENFPNASGPIALIHAVASVQNKIQLPSDAILAKFLAATKDQTPEARGTALKDYKELMEIQAKSESQPPTTEPTPYHYVAIVQHQGTMYELDGTKIGPKAHGTTSAETFVQDAAKACKKFIEENPGEHNYAILALSSV
ncbi:unnamed protein product [Notodromas monacha]|uniref:Ubiquitin carboxyl-terminal hydrolase n=1 Tax=Notodromas monacha TaxID=399045 RepID=A0A7R9BDR9_9CRUS|nr:unnamed protein product [Notodromas monacha]CAG0912788.1 unnamed protein product [Notodromas monacha]